MLGTRNDSFFASYTCMTSTANIRIPKIDKNCRAECLSIKGDRRCLHLGEFVILIVRRVNIQGTMANSCMLIDLLHGSLPTLHLHYLPFTLEIFADKKHSLDKFLFGLVNKEFWTMSPLIFQ